MKKTIELKDKKKVYINGYFTKEHINGVPRYAIEIVKRLDKYFLPGEAVMVIPKDARYVPQLENISICRWEDRGYKRESKSVLWGEITYRKYIRDKNCLNVNFTNKGEKYCNSITTLHDLIMLDNYEFAFDLSIKEKIKYIIYEKIDRIWFWHKLNLKKQYAIKLVTVSETSRRTINEKLKIPLNKINVIGNGWEHILEIDSKNSHKDIRIKEKKYYFSIGNIKAHKNFQWILEEARILPKEIFVIAGKIPVNIVKTVKVGLPNVIMLGHVSDEYMKFLMENAKGLLFPSFNEGFGIPPLEAIALGTPVAVADIPVMHEIFEDSVGYFDPYKSYNDLKPVFSMRNINTVEKVLKQHSWKEESKKWYHLIDENR